MDTYESRVARGIAVLDEIEPGWRTRIDLDKLRHEGIVSAEGCIIGQLFGWREGMDVLWSRAGIDCQRSLLAHHGFEITDDEHYDYATNHYMLLTDAWLEALDA